MGKSIEEKREELRQMPEAVDTKTAGRISGEERLRLRGYREGNKGRGIVGQAMRNADNLRKKFPGQDEGDDYAVNTFRTGEPNIDPDIQKAAEFGNYAPRKKPKEGKQFSGR